MRKILFAIVSLGALFGFAGTASAQTATDTFEVTATVLGNCTVTANDLGFGNYTPGGGDVTSTSTINVYCTTSTGFDVHLSTGGSGDYAQREMASGPNALEYNLYTSNTHTTVWGDTTNSTGEANGTGLGMSTAVPFTVYGQVLDSANNQNAPPGSYLDTITVTVNY
jgi:spore coat protein U-like protein